MTAIGGYARYAVKSMGLSAKGYVVGMVKNSHEFRRELEYLERTQWLDQERMRNLQEEKLRLMIRHAYENVPYYRDLFHRRRLSPGDFQTVDDLKKLPILTKQMLRARPDEFIARTAKKRLLISGWTTGTSGTPINAFRTRDSIVFEHAMIWRQRHWAGVDMDDRKAAVWGTVWNKVIIPSRGVTSPPYWRYNKADRQMLFSYFHMSDATLPYYIEKLEEFRPSFLEGFPSTLLILANYLKRINRRLRVQAIFVSSEPLYQMHRELLEDRFATRVFDLYGQAERVAAATECERHAGLHVNPEYGILEVIKDGRDAQPGESGEVIGTGLNNFAMPLLRYRTGDLAKVAGTPCACGRKMPLLEAIEGRIADTVITPDGTHIPGNGLMGAFHGIENVRETQIVQPEIGWLRVKIVRNDPRRPVDTHHVVRNLHACVGRAMRIEVELVGSIDHGERGKFRWVVSQLDRESVRRIVESAA